MHFSSTLLTLIPALAVAAPVEPPQTPLLPDGLPNPSPEQLQKIEQAAHGTIAGLPLPANVSAVGITNLQLLAFHEYVEVAFFYELIGNITRNVPGYEFHKDADREFALRSLTTILAVSQLSL
jgi:hypothetical protein